jgi:hypothetical protein
MTKSQERQAVYPRTGSKCGALRPNSGEFTKTSVNSLYYSGQSPKSLSTLPTKLGVRPKEQLAGFLNTICKAAVKPPTNSPAPPGS